MWTLGYIALIVLVNWGFTVVPLVPLPTGDMFPPLSLIVGLVFVARDFSQREIGHYVIAAMMLAGGLSWMMADPFVAFASVSAFLISEFADWFVYTWTKRPLAERILISSAIATPVDSAVFLGIIGHLTPTAVIVMTASKMVGALVVWLTIRNRPL